MPVSHCSLQDDFTINVRMPDGVQLVPLTVNGSDSIAAVKGQIRAVAGVQLSAVPASTCLW
jgi:hypothetical protein